MAFSFKSLPEPVFTRNDFVALMDFFNSELLSHAQKAACFMLPGYIGDGLEGYTLPKPILEICGRRGYQFTGDIIEHIKELNDFRDSIEPILARMNFNIDFIDAAKIPGWLQIISHEGIRQPLVRASQYVCRTGGLQLDPTDLPEGNVNPLPKAVPRLTPDMINSISTFLRLPENLRRLYLEPLGLVGLSLQHTNRMSTSTINWLRHQDKNFVGDVCGSTIIDQYPEVRNALAHLCCNLDREPEGWCLAGTPGRAAIIISSFCTGFGISPIPPDANDIDFSPPGLSTRQPFPFNYTPEFG